MKQVVFIAAMIGMMVMSQVSNAQPIAHRQYNQHHRIQNGVRNGSLTRREAHRLHAQQTIIRHDKRMAMADGRMHPHERAIINREQQRANHSIYNKKHNNYNRFKR